jgi:hydroxymethylpyrimidine pyrophosphatase-like HAD family hydrolase
VSTPPGLVVLDLDGTVVPYSAADQQPSERVRQAIAGLLAAGVPVTVATGRAVWGALRAVRALGLDGGGPLSIVCSNGAVVYDVVAGRITHRVTIDPGPAVRALLAVNPAVGLAVERGTEGYRYNGSFERNFTGRFVGEVDIPTLVSEPTTRLVCRLPGDRGYVSWSAARRDEAHRLVEVADLPGLGYWTDIGFSGWIDIIAAGVSKATGAAQIAADLGVDAADVVAVGDGDNDLPLFAWAGHPVAMGQATQAVRDAAREVTAPVEEDGVALLLERWL